MNDILKEIIHYGMPKRSGRYPWGSGETPYQRTPDFLSRVEAYKKDGLSETKRAEAFGLNTTQLRVQVKAANQERRSLLVATAKGLRDKGYSLNQIAEKMGYNNDSSVRSLLNENAEARMNQAENVAIFLKEQVNKKGMLDVGASVERSIGADDDGTISFRPDRDIGVSPEMMRQALYILEMEGYKTFGRRVPQVTNPGKQTTIQVLTRPGTVHKDIYDAPLDAIKTVGDYYFHDATKPPNAFVYPKSMDSKRIYIRYAEDGGSKKDGLIEIRRNVDDLSMGDAVYSQVRILVDDTHYMKGMAVYSDDIPDGADIIFNTNKSKGTPIIGPKNNTVLKNIEKDPDNPFGSLIKAGGQSRYTDSHGKEQLSLINKRAEEGDWQDWADNLSAQFLSKQNLSLIKKQLGEAMYDKQSEFEEIKNLSNPTVKRVLLSSFSDDCDAAAVHLKAAALPRQQWQVIIPVPKLKDTEVYAPNYNNGEKVVLIRYPHGGTFEIPTLTVNNKNPDARKVLGDRPFDAIGINEKVAARLSGADFDGDTVMVIPINDRIKITSTPALDELQNFDPKLEYGGKEPGTFRPMMNTQTEMGIISNLITDMTIIGATREELARAVRHSMVVIDAEKHGLDYKQSAADNGIAALHKKYQGSTRGGAATIVSRSKSETPAPKTVGSPIIEEMKETGRKVYKVDDRTYTHPKTGRVVTPTRQSTKMAETEDAFTLVSNTAAPSELAYAEYANKLKALGNQARKEMMATPRLEYSKSAKTTYQREVDALMAKLNISLKNASNERMAQRLANAAIARKKEAEPGLKKAELRKLSQQALAAARIEAGAQRVPVQISEREWEAIQAGAISDNILAQILRNADLDKVRQLATPKSTTELTPAKVNRIKALSASGRSNAEIAMALGISTSTVIKYLKGL